MNDGKVERETADGETYRLVLTDAEQHWFMQNTGRRFNGKTN